MTLPNPKAELLDLGNHCLQGLTDLGTELGILQYTEANFDPVVAALQKKQDDFNTARSVTAAAFAPYHQQLEAMKKGCRDARKLVSISWGDDWTTEWAQAGWNNNTTEVPRSVANLAALCTGLGTFLGKAANASYIVDTERVVFTAARYTALIGTYTSLERVLSDAHTAQRALRDARTDEDEALRDALRGLISILEGKLDDNDPRWDQFGLPRPGATVTPEQPQNLTASKSGSTIITVLASCDPTPLTTYYRWFAKLEGVDGEYRFLGRTKDPLKQITGQPAAGTLTIKVEAANEAGPGPDSEPAEIELG